MVLPCVPTAGAVTGDIEVEGSESRRFDLLSSAADVGAAATGALVLAVTIGVADRAPESIAFWGKLGAMVMSMAGVVACLSNAGSVVAAETLGIGSGVGAADRLALPVGAVDWDGGVERLTADLGRALGVVSGRIGLVVLVLGLTEMPSMWETCGALAILAAWLSDLVACSGSGCSADGEARLTLVDRLSAVPSNWLDTWLGTMDRCAAADGPAAGTDAGGWFDGKGAGDRDRGNGGMLAAARVSVEGMSQSLSSSVNGGGKLAGATDGWTAAGVATGDPVAGWKGNGVAVAGAGSLISMVSAGTTAAAASGVAPAMLPGAVTTSTCFAAEPNDCSAAFDAQAFAACGSVAARGNAKKPPVSVMLALPPAALPLRAFTAATALDALAAALEDLA